MFLPISGMAELVGSVDKRRYVTAEEKTQFPYNTVVKFETANGPSTGTFISPYVILTCRHCVDDVGNYGDINFYTTDGEKHLGRVWIPKANENGFNTDYALVRSMDYVFDGTTPKLVPYTVYGGTVKRSGYEALKILTDSELRVIKETIATNLELQNGAKRDFYENMAILGLDLFFNHACKSDSDTDCVHCSADPMDGCIFNDDDNLKTQDSCNITHKESGELVINCAGFPGTSGAVLMSNNDNSIRGIIVSIAGGLELGTSKTPRGGAVRPEEYYKYAEFFIKEMEHMAQDGK